MPHTYHISGDAVTDPLDYFLLDSETGELRTAKPLDREALLNSTGVISLIIKVGKHNSKGFTLS